MKTMTLAKRLTKFFHEAETNARGDFFMVEDGVGYNLVWSVKKKMFVAKRNDGVKQKARKFRVIVEEVK